MPTSPLCGRLNREHFLLPYVGRFREPTQPACNWETWAGTQVDWFGGAKLLFQRDPEYKAFNNMAAGVSVVWHSRGRWSSCIGFWVADMLHVVCTFVSASGKGENISKEASQGLHTHFSTQHCWLELGHLTAPGWKAGRKRSLQHIGGHMSGKTWNHEKRLIGDSLHHKKCYNS